MTDLIYKDEVYKLAGFFMEVQNELGPGLLKITYKDAIERKFDEHII